MVGSFVQVVLGRVTFSRRKKTSHETHEKTRKRFNYLVSFSVFSGRNKGQGNAHAGRNDCTGSAVRK